MPSLEAALSASDVYRRGLTIVESGTPRSLDGAIGNYLAAAKVHGELGDFDE